MNSFKKRLAVYSAMLAFLTVSTTAVYAVSSVDVVGKTSNVDVRDTSSTRTDIEINSHKHGDVAQVDWSKFNVGKNERVNFGFSGLSQTMINRVLGGQSSKILGQLTNSCTAGTCDAYAQTSKVILINPAGVMFGAGSKVDLNSFTVSTFDFRNAQNLKGTEDVTKSSYYNNVLKGFSPVGKAPNGRESDYVVNGTGNDWAYIPFDARYTKAFQEKGLNADNNSIDLDGTTFAHFNRDGNDNLLDTLNDANPNKTINILADNVNYKDSLLRTGDNFNYTGSNFEQSTSNVRIVTSDGIAFSYVQNGYSDIYRGVDENGNLTKNIKDTRNVDKNIAIENNNAMTDATPAIKSGSVHIRNFGNTDNSKVKIKETIVKAQKLVNDEDGNIIITSNNDVNVENSRLESANTAVTNKAGNTVNTLSQEGGEVYIDAGKNATVEDSILISAGSTNHSGTAGMVRVQSQDKTTIDNSKVHANGDALVYSNGKVEIKDSFVDVDNVVDSTQTTNANIFAPEEIKLHNVAMKAGNIDIASIDQSSKTSGNIIISSDLDSNGKNQTLIKSANDLSIIGKNTTIDNGSLAYQTIQFYDNGTTGLNNVTVANNSTFSPIVNGKIGKDITLETNGNFTLDNAKVQRAGYSIDYQRNNGNIIDNGTADTLPYQISLTTADASNVNITSTEKDVIATNNTNVHAKNDVSLTSKKGSAFVNGNTKLKGDNDTNITAYNTIAFGNGKNIDNTADIQAGHDVNITSTNGDITAEKTDMPEIKYGNKLKFDAKKNNIFTSKNSLKSVNVDYVAGEANKFYTEGDIQFVNSSLEAPTNFVESGHDVIMNNLVIKNATPDAKDTKTEIFANGNVTTANVTNEDLTVQGGTFPQSVSVDRTGKGKTTLDVNKTKLAITTEVVKDDLNPDNGSITLDVKNANNDKAGLDLTAVNVDKLDQDPTGGNFKPGYYKAGDKKWDNNIDPKEGPEVTLNATDGEVAIANIETDKLNLDPNDNIIADKTSGTPVIEVKDQGGLNLDPTLDYPENGPDGFTYDKNYETHDKKTTGGDTTFTDWSEWEPTGKTWTDPDGTKHTEYVRTRDGVTTDRITTQTDKKHTITFDNEGNPSEFTLVYDKTKTTVEPGSTIKGKDVMENPSLVDKPEEYVQRKDDKCEPMPPVNPRHDDIDATAADSLINQIKLPREQVEISKTSKVADNTVDQSSNVMAAAAKVDLGKDATATYSDEDEDDLDIE